MADLPKLIKSFCCKALDLLLSEMADLPKLTKSFLLQILLEMPELAKLTKSFLDRGEKVEDIAELFLNIRNFGSELFYNV